MKDKWTRHDYRKERTRSRLRDRAGDRPRLCVHRSLRFLYAQVIDDSKGVTLAAASSRGADGAKKASWKSVADARVLGKLIAEKALKAGVTQVVFDRGGSIYHGRIKALAEAAREAGLKF